jgi:hypothetical protein
MGRVISTLTWVFQLVRSSPARRTEAKKLALDHIRHFKRGKKSEQGENLVKQLIEEFDFVGFTPNVTYVKEKGIKQDLNAQWVHPFSIPTLLFKHKELPILAITNGNLDFNDSRLRKIDKNIDLEELQDILGITG